MRKPERICAVCAVAMTINTVAGWWQRVGQHGGDGDPGLVSGGSHVPGGVPGDLPDLLAHRPAP